MDGWMDGWMKICMYGWMYVCMDGWMDGWMDTVMTITILIIDGDVVMIMYHNEEGCHIIVMINDIR